MTNENDYRVNIEVTTKNLESALNSFKEIQDLLAALQGGQPIDFGDFEQLSRSIERVADTLRTAGSAATEFGDEFAAMQARVREAEEAFQKFNAGAVLEGASGKGEGLLANFSPEQIKEAQQMANFFSTTLVSAIREAEKASEDFTAAQERQASVLQKIGYDRIAQETDRVTAAIARLRDAEAELASARKGSKSANTDAEKAAATDRVTKALTSQHAAQKELSAAQEEADRKAAEQSNRLAMAEEKLSEAKQKVKAAHTGDEIGRIAQAKELELQATGNLIRAELDLQKARAGGNPDDIARATTNLAARNSELASAIQGVTRQTQESANSLPRLRYAMYDVSRTATMLGTALMAIPAASAAAFTKFDADMAGVVRTTQTYLDSTGGATERLTAQFYDLYAAIPSDWGALTDIGTLAGQLNIASEDVGRFTELVAQFSSSSNVSVEESATAFGRLSELLDVASYEYQNLGSSILAVGINSVATESQIISISQQIAGIAGTAGLSADEVVGLSSALASIGTAPELSRGIVTRLFTNIMTSVSAGGEELEKFAKISGVTASEFADLWGNDASGAIYKLMEGIGKLEGDKALQALSELGIKQVRDIPAVLKLAQNYELLGASLDIAAEGYENGTLLAEQFGVTSQTLSARVTLLKNSFGALLASLGESAKAFIPLIDFIAKVTNNLAKLVRTDIGKWVAAGALAISALVGAIALGVAGFATLYGSYLAMQVVLKQTTARLQEMAPSANTAAVAISGTGTAAKKSAGDFVQFRAALAASGLQAKILSATLKTALISTGIGAVIAGVGLLYEEIVRAQGGVKGLYGDFQELQGAIQMDTEAFNMADSAEGFFTVEVSLSQAAAAGEEMTDSLARVLGIADESGKAVDALTSSTDKLTIAMGENVVAAITRAIFGNEEFMNAVRGSEAELDRFGFALDDFTDNLVAGTGKEYFAPILEEFEVFRAEMIRSLGDGDLVEGSKLFHVMFQDLNQTISTVSGTVNKWSDDLANTALMEEFVARNADRLGVSAKDLDSDLEGLSETTKNLLDLYPQLSTMAADTQGSLHDLAQTFMENGSALDMYSTQGRENISALDSTLEQLWKQGGQNASGFANEIAQMFAYMGGAGVELGSDFDYLRDIMVNTFNQQYGLNLSTAQARQSIHAFINDAIEAIKAVAILEKRQVAMAAQVAASASDPRIAKVAAGYAKNFAAQAENTANTARQLINLRNQLEKAGDAGQVAGNQINDAMRRAGGGAKKAAKDANDAKEALRTLTDYANDLASIWDRAFQFRFSGEQTFDSITTSLRGVAERFDAAAKRVKDLRLELQRLNADLTGLKAELSLQEYFLSIAVEYGDTARAEQIQAKIADLNADIASKQKDVTVTSKEMKRAQEQTSKSLTSNTDTAIKNRRELEALVKEYQDHIKALADTGASEDELKRKTESLREDFVKQATQLGFNREEVKKYADSFDDVMTAIINVPRDITVKMGVNDSPATKALNEWIAKNNNKTVQLNTKMNNPGTVSGGSWKPNSIGVGNGGMTTPKLEVKNDVDAKKGFKAGGPVSGSSLNISGTLKAAVMTVANSSIQNILTRFARFFGFSDGGIVPHYLATGGVLGLHPGRPMGTDTVPAWLTPGEAVIRQSSVKYYGEGAMNALNDRKIPREALYSTSSRRVSQVQYGVASEVALTAGTIQAIAQAVQPYLVVNDKVISGANSTVAVNETAFGRR